MENGERVIISGKATPKTGMLVAGIFAILAIIVYMVLNFMTSRNEELSDMARIAIVLAGIGATVLLRFYFKSKKSVITVTNKRITGATAWGSTVDLPLNQVVSAAIEATGALVISTHSGQTIFAKMDNTPQIFAAINKLLMVR